MSDALKSRRRDEIRLAEPELLRAGVHQLREFLSAPRDTDCGSICGVVSRRQQHSAAEGILRDDVALLQAHRRALDVYSPAVDNERLVEIPALYAEQG